MKKILYLDTAEFQTDLHERLTRIEGVSISSINTVAQAVSMLGGEYDLIVIGHSNELMHGTTNLLDLAKLIEEAGLTKRVLVVGDNAVAPSWLKDTKISRDEQYCRRSKCGQWLRLKFLPANPTT